MNRRLFSKWLIFASYQVLFLKWSFTALNSKRGILLHYTYTKSSITIPYHPAFKVFMQRSSPVFNRVSQEWNRLLWQLKQWKEYCNPRFFYKKEHFRRVSWCSICWENLLFSLFSSHLLLPLKVASSALWLAAALATSCLATIIRGL